MTGRWGQDLDELFEQTSVLLSAGDRSLRDLAAAVLARDTVLWQVREMVRAVADVPRLVPLPGLALQVRSGVDLTSAPAQALHHGLQALPRALPFGAVQLSDGTAAGATGYDRAWAGAAVAALSLQRHNAGLGELPGPVAWQILREVSDVAAALPYLDSDLAALVEGAGPVSPLLAQALQQLRAPHDWVRLGAAELRGRVPAPHRGAGRAAVVVPLRPGVHTFGLDIAALATRVAARGDRLAVPELRATCLLLTHAADDAAVVLEGATMSVGGAAELAARLRTVSERAAELYEVPLRGTEPVDLRLVARANELMPRLGVLSSVLENLPRGAAPAVVQRVVEPAVAFAEQAPALVDALHASVSDSLRTEVLLVANNSSRPELQQLAWVGVRWTAAAGPSAPQRASAALQAAGEQLGQSAKAARVHMHFSQTTATNSASASAGAQQTGTERALAKARRQVHGAYGEMLTSLNVRMAADPTPLARPLPEHPRMTPGRQLR